MTARKPALLFVFFVLLIDVLGFGLLVPVLPSLVMKLQGGGEAEATPIVTSLIATYAAMVFLFSPLLGALSDRYGRRPVLLLSMLGSGLDYFAMALAPTVPWLFVTRALNGLTGASVTAASAYIADVTTPEKRAAGFAIIGAAFGLGFTLGPVLGGVLSQVHLTLPFYAAGGLALLNAAFGLFVMPESLPKERRNPSSPRSPFAALTVLRQYPLARRLAFALFFMQLAQFALHGSWALYTRYRYGWNETEIGLSLCAVGLGAVIVQGGLLRRIVPRIGERRAVVIGVVLVILGYIGYGIAPVGWVIYAAIAVQSLGGIAGPSCQALISKSVRADEQGVVQGSLTSVQGLANIFGPLLGGALLAWSIASSRAQPIPGVLFYGCAALATIGLAIAVVVLRMTPSAAPPSSAPTTSP